MLTGDSRLEAIEGSKVAGAVDFVVKPFTRQLLVKKLDRIFRLALTAQVEQIRLSHHCIPSARRLAGTSNFLEPQ
jgi:FixJ family two-component response regulator